MVHLYSRVGDVILTKCISMFYCASNILIIIIIIIINFYGAYILRNLSSEAQQNKIIKHSREQVRAKVIIRTRNNRRFMVKMQFGINVLSFFRKIAVASDVFRVMGSSFKTLGRTDRESDRESTFTQVLF